MGSITAQTVSRTGRCACRGRSRAASTGLGCRAGSALRRRRCPPLTRWEVLSTAAAASVAAAVLNPEASAVQADEERLKGNIKHSVVFWCFNIAGENWGIDRTCSVAKSLGCKSVEICGPAEWPTVKKYGLTCAMA